MANPITGSPSKISHVTKAEFTPFNSMVTLSGADRVSGEKGNSQSGSCQGHTSSHVFDWDCLARLFPFLCQLQKSKYTTLLKGWVVFYSVIKRLRLKSHKQLHSSSLSLPLLFLQGFSRSLHLSLSVSLFLSTCPSPLCDVEFYSLVQWVKALLCCSLCFQKPHRLSIPLLNLTFTWVGVQARFFFGVASMSEGHHN